MGNTTMRTAVFVALLAFTVGIWAVTEVQELGNDDSTNGVATSLDADDSAEYDDMGEGVGGRRGAFLSTSGSFTLSSGGGNRGGTGGEEDELGEGMDMGEGFGGRRGAFLSTSGSFTLSSGGSNRIGTGGEEDEYEF